MVGYDVQSSISHTTTLVAKLYLVLSAVSLAIATKYQSRSLDL